MAAKLNKTDSQLAAPPGERVRIWLLAGLTAVCVARPLVPSEGVAWQGDGHVFTMLLLLIAAGYLALVGVRQALIRPLDALDVCVALLITALVGSPLLGMAARNAGFGSSTELHQRLTAPRPAVNMIWEFVGLGLVFFLTRQLVAKRTEARWLTTIMVALALGVSIMGLYQAAVTLPAERAAYAEHPDAVLQAAGQWHPPDSPERLRFEARLASTEPLATFALTNSLAGFLVVWLVVALGIAWQAFGGLVRRNQAVPAGGATRWTGVAVVYCLLSLTLMLICLLLTRSRSAYVALFVGLLLLPLALRGSHMQISRRLATGLVGGCVVLLCAVVVASWDNTLWSQAQKSLGYRFEYWDATLNMIADFPLFGVGSGEFQNYYTQYKLPAASEEVSDPHNFVLEVWATGGTLALLALSATLAAFGLRSGEASREARSAAPVAADVGASDAGKILALGALAGLPLAYVAGLPFGFLLPFEQLLVATILGAGLVLALATWAVGGTLPPRLLALGVVVWAIHLLASGGFSFPGVAYSFWILLALSTQSVEIVTSEHPPVWTGWRRWALPVGLTVPVLLVSYSCYRSALLPVAAARAAMALANDPRMTDDTRFHAMLGAINADPLSAEPWLACAQLSAERLAADPGNQVWEERLYRSVSSAITLQHSSSATARQVHRLFQKVYDTAADKKKPGEWLLTAARSAAHLYPNSAVLQGEYAEALDRLGNERVARQTALRALELDELTPHADKKLSPELRTKLQMLAANSATASPPAEGDTVQ